jgi:hypothetical protein
MYMDYDSSSVFSCQGMQPRVKSCSLLFYNDTTKMLGPTIKIFKQVYKNYLDEYLFLCFRQSHLYKFNFQ